MARVNELIPSLRVDSLDPDGRGVGRRDGKVVFIHGALPGELVSATVFRRRRQFDEANVTQVLEASAERSEPRCAHFGVCGGCTLQHLAPDAQVAHKCADVLDKLERLAGVVPDALQPPIVGPAWGYRRKARLGCKHVPGKGGVLVGFRERGNSFIADIAGCHVLVPEVGERIGGLRDLLGSLDARDAIPQIEVAAGDRLTLLVVRHLTELTQADRDRLADFARETGLAIALQSGGPHSVQALYPVPMPTLSYELAALALRLEFEALDFVQVNAAVNEQLVMAALDALDPAPGESVLDLFSGLGNFSVAIAARGARVLALELGEAMVARARHNAHLNALGERVQAEVADLNERDTVERRLASGAQRILIDPPRSGAEEVVNALPRDGVSRLVYVSCNPATLARDAATLVHEKGMRLSSVRVVDMFANTSHVESLAVFDR